MSPWSNSYRLPKQKFDRSGFSLGNWSVNQLFSLSSCCCVSLIWKLLHKKSQDTFNNILNVHYNVPERLKLNLPFTLLGRNKFFFWFIHNIVMTVLQDFSESSLYSVISIFNISSNINKFIIFVYNLERLIGWKRVT